MVYFRRICHKGIHFRRVVVSRELAGGNTGQWEVGVRVTAIRWLYAITTDNLCTALVARYS